MRDFPRKARGPVLLALGGLGIDQLWSLDGFGLHAITASPTSTATALVPHATNGGHSGRQHVFRADCGHSLTTPALPNLRPSPQTRVRTETKTSESQ
ncbi:hypothetical protein PF001_g33428 [Phytophthora fragariae]|uniref:Uncharacterized protein n=1 Tax=Phytophthora fragariae TaxID=53985 RepID=A0A6A4A6I4_9STRA|nr:hypothetical protein PF003_g36121 [Phytophthora fragariae]KAE9253015.1 hypothetical protein PF001_g33428 [Phytophthora fragariae]